MRKIIRVRQNILDTQQNIVYSSRIGIIHIVQQISIKSFF